MTPEEENFKSRIETLDELYKRFRQELHGLDFNNAVAYSSPMADCFLMAIAELQAYNGRRTADRIINEVFSKPDDSKPQ